MAIINLENIWSNNVFVYGGINCKIMDFFEDVCTVKEVQSIAQRFAVAKLLKDGKTYAEVANETGASTATISRVNRSLNYGNDGYDMVFKRVYGQEEEK